MQQPIVVAIIKAIFQLAGSFLVGHSLFGHPILGSDLTGLLGAVMILVSLVYGIRSHSVTSEQVQDGVLSVFTTVLGLLSSYGAISGSTSTAILSALSSLLPVILVQAKTQSVKGIERGALGASGGRLIKLPPKVGMKTAIIFLLIGLCFTASGQTEISLPSDSALRETVKMALSSPVDAYVYVDHLPLDVSKLSPETQALLAPGHKMTYRVGIRYFLKHRPTPAQLQTASGKLGAPPSGADTTIYEGWQPVASLVLEAYSPVTKAWTVLAGTGIGFEHDTWKTVSNGGSYWYTDWSVSALVYAGGALGTTPAPPTTPSAVGAAGVTVSVLNKYVTAGWAYDFVNKGPLYTIGSSINIF